MALLLNKTFYYTLCYLNDLNWSNLLLPVHIPHHKYTDKLPSYFRKPRWSKLRWLIRTRRCPYTKLRPQKPPIRSDTHNETILKDLLIK